MEWNHETVLHFIELYSQCPELWNPLDNNYHMRNKKQDAWEKIAGELHCDIDVAKIKMNSLLSSYRREKAKTKKSTGTGKGRREIYVSNWFAFQSFGFLMDKDKPTHHIDTENISDEDDDSNNETSSLGTEGSTSGKVDAESNPATKDQAKTNEDIETPKVQGKRKLFLSPKKPPAKKKKEVEDNSMITHAYNILKSVSSAEGDECSIYGEHVANQLRQLDGRTRTITMHQLNNTLFEAKMGTYTSSYPYGQPIYSNNNISHSSSPHPSQHFYSVPSPAESVEASSESQLSPLQGYINTFTDMS